MKYIVQTLSGDNAKTNFILQTNNLEADYS